MYVYSFLYRNSIKKNGKQRKLHSTQNPALFYTGAPLGHTCVFYLKINLRTNGMIIRANGIITRANGLRSRENGIINIANEIKPLRNEIIIRANGIRSRETK